MLAGVPPTHAANAAGWGSPPGSHPDATAICGSQCAPIARSGWRRRGACCAEARKKVCGECVPKRCSAALYKCLACGEQLNIYVSTRLHRQTRLLTLLAHTLRRARTRPRRRPRMVFDRAAAPPAPFSLSVSAPDPAASGLAGARKRALRARGRMRGRWRPNVLRPVLPG